MKKSYKDTSSDIISETIEINCPICGAGIEIRFPIYPFEIMEEK